MALVPRRSLLIALRVLVLAVFMVATLRASLFTIYRVAGTSMLDTLGDGDRILVCDAPWLMHPVEAGDTVVFEVDGEVLVKRVLAAPGDTISMLSGRVLRNGRDVAEDIPEPYKRPDDMPSTRMGTDQYFVLGDHRAVSVDSRDFGPVAETQLIGKVMLRMSGDGISSVAALERRP